MSLDTIITVPFVISVGLFFFTSGLCGNVLNIIIFYRNDIENPSTFLLFVSSCFSLIYIIGGLLTRILAVGFDIDPTRTNLQWCKTRTYLGQSSSLISLSCICYAWCDQLFITSQKEKWRRQSELNRTKFVTLIIILYWLIYMIPFFVLAEQVSNGNGTFTCNVYVNENFRKYFSYFHQPIIAAVIPILFIIGIGILIYRNVSLLRINRCREKVQRNLTSMILFQTVFIGIQSIPYGFFTMYLTSSSHETKSLNRLEIESVILNIFSIFYYFSHAFSFLIYYISSSTYRGQIKQILNSMITIRSNRIAPEP